MAKKFVKCKKAPLLCQQLLPFKLLAQCSCTYYHIQAISNINYPLIVVLTVASWQKSFFA